MLFFAKDSINHGYLFCPQIWLIKRINADYFFKSLSEKFYRKVRKGFFKSRKVAEPQSFFFLSFSLRLCDFARNKLANFAVKNNLR
ncbi:hypothetical protein BXU01_04710 [[Flexibacter] sp. ATCC 35103]|nr:hypothetical protein BXU01_04710 [[Flexibacter] sp. ATCC 35103]